MPVRPRRDALTRSSTIALVAFVIAFAQGSIASGIPIALIGALIAAAIAGAVHIGFRGVVVRRTRRAII
jgi:hypothetical protein